MKVYETTSKTPHCSAPPDREHRAITIGNFDGCHIGHRKLIEITKSFGPELTPTSLSFSPHPSEIVGIAARNQPRLFSQSQKMRAFDELGLEEAIVQKFDRNFAEYSPTAFLNEYLKNSLEARAIVVGDNFCFGKNREGDAQWLSKAGAESDIQVKIVSPQEVDSTPVSSSRVKKVLSEGKVDEASTLLGRPYLLEAGLRSDQMIGRKIGSPTLNLKQPAQMLPKIGVYAGWISILPQDKHSSRTIMRLDQEVMPAAINIGTRPTVSASNESIHIEAHAIDQKLSFEMTPSTNIGIYFVGRLRDQATFDSLESLRKQIVLDVAKARKILSI